MSPAAQLDVQDRASPAPDALVRPDGWPAAPLVVVMVDGVQARGGGEQGLDVRLLRRLAGEEVGGGGGEDQPDGEGRRRVGLG